MVAKKDPENASRYFANRDQALAKLDRLIDELHQALTGYEGIKFIVFHDAYQYFERRFGVLASGAISIGDAQDPSPARVAEIRDLVSDLKITCVYTEPQYNAGLVNSVFNTTRVNTIGVMDPLGAAIQPGKDQYGKLLVGMLASLQACTK